MPTALVTGAGGFIGGHLVKRLLRERFLVCAVDIKPLSEWWQLHEHAANIVGDLREEAIADGASRDMDYVYQLAADMGGAGYVFSGDNDSEILQNNLRINLNIARYALANKAQRILYASSACVYPKHNQEDPNNPNCVEHSAYPACPDSEYGWEKLISERLYLALARNHGLSVRIARLHNVYGPYGSWNDGREKAPAALCRKVAQCSLNHVHSLDVWGDGTYTRSFMYIDDCVEGLRRLMDSNVSHPLNLGSEQMVTINQLVATIAEVAGTEVHKSYDRTKPQGVAGRNSDNRLIRQVLNWEPSIPLREGLKPTYEWILAKVKETCVSLS